MDWIPKYIKLNIENKPKDVVNADYWNALWNLVIEQGDYNTAALVNIHQEVAGINARIDAYKEPIASKNNLGCVIVGDLLEVDETGLINVVLPEDLVRNNQVPAIITDALAEAKATGAFDGYSPTANVEKIESGVKITITDKTGTTTAEVKDGKAGSDANVTPENIEAALGYTPASEDDIPSTTETWTFTLEDGSTVTKEVYVR